MIPEPMHAADGCPSSYHVAQVVPGSSRSHVPCAAASQNGAQLGRSSFVWSALVGVLPRLVARPAGFT